MFSRQEICKRYQEKHKEKISAKLLIAKQKDPEKFRERSRRWNAANPEKVQKAVHKFRGIPPADRPRPEICDCCQKPEAARGFQRLALDHCHVTGKFRGWLCMNCNTAIGRLGDNSESVKRAVRYLEDSERRNNG